MTSNNLYVVLHGHFYQPPREDPWTGEIDRQPSAHPFHDWNARIHQECYAANAASRVLSPGGMIEDIINNYEYLSFNFGPTLVDWMRKNDPKTIEKIVQADKISAERNNGHGNAIAQVYNHIIMPLASDDDKITQIEWGLKHFENTYGRKAEGIWLAETAVNNRTAELLIDYGMKFIILAPGQVQSVRPFDGDWQDVSDSSVDATKPYLLKQANGEIACFFYYGGLASKLSFEHLLQSVDFIRGELLHLNDESRENFLIHTATDGEIYGHHEAFGDMCLAKMINDNKKEGDFIFTNYARALEIFPPTDECLLKDGNEGLGTAWSCAHGVDRWRKDCGCSTGAQEGWNQKWRGPFRDALNLLRDRLFEAAERELNPVLGDFKAARNAYIDVVYASVNDNREAAVEEFFARFDASKLSDAEKTNVLHVMEALHHELLTYTSCAWFFAEISGIETVQAMCYAERLLELSEDILPADTKDTFLEILSHGESNIPQYQDGKWIFENFVEKNTFPVEKVINQYLLENLLICDKITGKEQNYYYYQIKVDKHEDFTKGAWNVYAFELTVENTILRDKQSYIAYVFQNSENEFKTFVKKLSNKSLREYLSQIIEKDNARELFRDFSEWFTVSYSMEDMKFDSKSQMLAGLTSMSLATLHNHMRKMDYDMDSYLQLLDFYRRLSVDLPARDMVAMRELLNSYIFGELETVLSSGLEKFDYMPLVKVIQTARKTGVGIDEENISAWLRAQVLSLMEDAVVKMDAKTLTRLEKVIDFANFSGLDFEKYEIQNLIFARLSELTEELLSKRGLFGRGKDSWEKMKSLAEKFNIQTHCFEGKLKKV